MIDDIISCYLANRGYDTKVAPVSGSNERNKKSCPLSSPPINLSAIASRLWAWQTLPRCPQEPGFPDFFGFRTLSLLSCPDPRLGDGERDGVDQELGPASLTDVARPIRSCWGDNSGTADPQHRRDVPGG